MTRSCWYFAWFVILVVTITALGPLQCLAVEYANIDIADDGVDPINNPPTVSIPSGQGTSGYFLESGATTGNFPVRIGASATDDAASGVLLGYVREIGRSEPNGIGGSETLYATSANDRDASGSFSLVAHRAGAADVNSLYVSGASFNANLASAYFPFSEGWLAGTVYNASNGTAFNELVASGGMQLGPGQNFQQDFFGVGDHLLTLPGVTDARRQGLLLVNGAKDEGNYALSEPTADGSGFTITGHDNASNGSQGEVDPVSFVFIPLGTPNVTMARIFARGHGPEQKPQAMIQSGDPFTISRENPGEYRLSIPGQSPASGALLMSPSGANDGDNGNNSDNVVTYQADGNDWMILAQDLVVLDGTGQESGDRAESYFSFAFLPFNTPVSAPGPIPAVSTLTNFNRSRSIGWNAQVTAISDGNSPGDMFIDEAEQTTDINLVSLFENRGDNVFAVDGAFLAATEGVMFATVSEGLRDNSAVGGQFDYGVVAVSQSNDGEWWVHTTTADPVINAEHNINFSVAFFGADSGFQMGQHVPTVAGALEVTIPGVNSLNDGVLLTGVNAANQGNYVTATPRGDGSGWDVGNFDNDTIAEEQAVNHIFLPFDAENLIAGRVNEDGTLAASTDPSEFTLTHAGASGEYLLTIPGKTSSDGMLLLTSTGAGDSVDNALAYESAGSSFRILGLDMITVDEANGGALVDLEDTSFSFAYIDFDTPPELANAETGDFDGDGDIDGADFLLWQRGGSPHPLSASDLALWQGQFGTTPLAASVAQVPEPSAVLLLLAAGMLIFVYPSRSGQP